MLRTSRPHCWTWRSLAQFGTRAITTPPAKCKRREPEAGGESEAAQKGRTNYSALHYVPDQSLAGNHLRAPRHSSRLAYCTAQITQFNFIECPEADMRIRSNAVSEVGRLLGFFDKEELDGEHAPVPYYTEPIMTAVAQKRTLPAARTELQYKEGATRRL